MRQLLLSVVALAFVPSAWAVKCYDCVGNDCLGRFCDGDYCVLSNFASRWGNIDFGKPKVVKGCMKGNLLRNDVRSHCEVAEDDPSEVFTCFCDNKNNCNGGKAVTRLEKEEIRLIQCQCDGDHCDGKTCIGEMCTYVVNHKTNIVEKGCVNASIPLLERRSTGSCMIPPITGAMHHSVAMNPDELLNTESCVCGKEFCNLEKPKINVPETMNCPAMVEANIKGTKMKSINTTCDGEFCFKVEVESKELGPIKSYKAFGCASFTGEDDLAEELNAQGCAKFISERLNVTACYKTDNKDAVGRARAKQKITTRRGKGKGRKPLSREEEEEEEMEEDEEEEMEEQPMRKEKIKQKEEEDEPQKEETVEERRKEGEKENEEEKKEETPEILIFEKPTEAPIPDESNTTMITVFILIMLCIVVSGAVWKFELHKKLFRSSYDSVAGG